MTQKYFPGIFVVNHDTLFLRINHQKWRKESFDINTWL